MLFLSLVDFNKGADGFIKSERCCFCSFWIQTNVQKDLKRVKDALFALGGFKRRGRMMNKEKKMLFL
jgi:hypothetical protein